MPNWGSDLSASTRHINTCALDGEAGHTWTSSRGDETPTTAWHPRGGEAAAGLGVAAQYRVRGRPPESVRTWAAGAALLDTDNRFARATRTPSAVLRQRDPAGDNKFLRAEHRRLVGGSFSTCEERQVDIPLQAYFRIQHGEHGPVSSGTLIIVDEGAYVHYVEGSPRRSTLPTRALRGRGDHPAQGRQVPVQTTNGSNNVYNLVTKRAMAHAGATWNGSTATSAPRSP